MKTPLPSDVRRVFSRPFKVDEMKCFVFDLNLKMACSWMDSGEERFPFPRGWGHIQYVKWTNPDALFDKWEGWFEANVPASSDLDQVAAILNEAWADPSYGTSEEAQPDTVVADNKLLVELESQLEAEWPGAISDFIEEVEADRVHGLNGDGI